MGKDKPVPRLHIQESSSVKCISRAWDVAGACLTAHITPGFGLFLKQSAIFKIVCISLVAAWNWVVFVDGMVP